MNGGKTIPTGWEDLTMNANRVFNTTVFALVLGAAVAGLMAQRAEAQTFKITAVPVNASSGATESLQFTVSNIPMAGTMTVNCQYSGSSTFQEQAKLPVCGVGPVFAYTVSEGESISGTIGLAPWGTPVPASLKDRRGVRGASALALAGVLLLGLGLRRKTKRWLTLVGMAAAGLAFSLGVSACGGNSNGPMPGVYAYTVTAAVESSGVAPLGQQTGTSVNITVK
jgi:hypothetical protein